jgi:sarcosine oxidase gamma subunit
MTRLGFLSPANAAPGVAIASPLRHTLAAGIVDVSHLGKLELRGDLTGVQPAAGEDLLRLAPNRGLLVTEGSAPAAAERFAGTGVRAYDVTAALAGFEVEGEDVLRRLTELDLAKLPTAGSIARGTRAVIQRRDGERFRIFVAQELGHYVVEVVLDTLRGLGR